MRAMVGTWREVVTNLSRLSVHCRPFTGGAILLSLMISACTPGAQNAPGSSAVLTPTPPARKDVPPFSLHLLANGTELELAGGMPDGTTEAVTEKIIAMPKITVLHLNSEGGSVLEGHRLAVFIKAQGLITYTSATCASACTIAFLAGKERYLGTHGWLGFHSASKTLGGADFVAGDNAMRQLYLAEGLPADFIDKALATPARDVWYPTHEELIAAHAIDAVVDESRFARSGLAYWQSAADVDAEMQYDVLYATLAQHDPAAYAHIRDMFLAGAKTGRVTEDVRHDVNAYFIGTLLPTYLAKAPDKLLLRYWKSQIAEFDFLQQADPQTCVALAFPKLGLQSADLQHVLPAALRHEDTDSLATMIANGTIQSQPTADAAMVKDRLKPIVAAAQQESPDMLRAFTHPQAYLNDPSAICNATVFFLGKMLDLPDDDAAAIIRTFMAQK